MREFRIDGVLGLTNYGGIEIMLSNDSDSVYYRFNMGDRLPSKSKKVDIFYTNNDVTQEWESAFEINNIVYFISEFMKVKGDY